MITEVGVDGKRKNEKEKKREMREKESICLNRRDASWL